MEVIWKIVKVGFDWKLVGNRLLTPQSVTDISRDESDEANRRDKMLITWLQQDGAKATYARLVEVLKDVGRTDTAEKVIELVTGKGERWGKGIIKQSAYVVAGCCWAISQWSDR